MVTGLPSADSLLVSIAALRRRLATEESGFRNTPFTASSTDTNVTATANGMVEALTVRIKPAIWPPATAPAITALAVSLKDACAKVLAQANASTKPKASADANSYALTGIPAFNQPAPATPGFTTSDSDLTARLLALDPVISAKLFQGQSGNVSVVVDGTLTLVSLTLSLPLPLGQVTLENNVVIALNIALDKAKRLFEDSIKTSVDGGVADPSVITFAPACLWAQGRLMIADNVNVKQDSVSFAPVVNAGSTETNIGRSAQTGDLWSRAPVELRDLSKVNGNLRTMAALKIDAGASVTGLTTHDGALLQIPKLSLSVTFPGSNRGNREVMPGAHPTLDLLPDAYADVTVKGGTTLFLHGGTYFFNNWTVDSGGKISCASGSGVIINVRTNFIFRGTIVETGSSARPKVFVGVFGTNSIPIEGPFTGTLMALTAPITLATVNPPAVHTGAFYARDITVNPNNTITHFPFFGPTPTST